MRDVVAALRRVQETRARRVIVLVALALGLLVAAAVSLGLPSDQRTFVVVVGIVVLVVSVPVPFLGALLASDVRRSPLTARPAPTVVAAVLVAVAFAGFAVAVSAAAIAVFGSAPGRWEDAAMVAVGAVLALVMSQLVGVGLGSVVARPWVACLATVVLPLGVYVGLGLTPALSDIRDWVTPFASAQHLLSGRMSPTDWMQYVVVLVIWGRGLYAIGTLRLGLRGELIPVRSAL